MPIGFNLILLYKGVFSIGSPIAAIKLRQQVLLVQALRLLAGFHLIT
jgi:hypothetical protein